MFAFAKDKATARIAAEFYVNAINVMRGASGVDRYVGLAEQEAFDIEYWSLEEAKLQRMPKPRAAAGPHRAGHRRRRRHRLGDRPPHARRRRLRRPRRHRRRPACDAAVKALSSAYGKDVVTGVALDVTDETAVEAAFAEAALAFGGLDILVSNAGIASAAPIEETSLAFWKRNIDILGTGYFLASRAAFRLMKAQGIGGSIVFIGSKNGLAASPGASAYCSAKALELHLARCLALEGAPFGIRVNVRQSRRGAARLENLARRMARAARPVEQGDASRSWRRTTASARLLKLLGLPEDIAEAAYFLASDAASKSTGNIINVDAGNAVSFTR